jgi:hypothetical protein
VLRLHEALCFARAYPDNERILRGVRVMLDAFGKRPDLRRHAVALADSGITGTSIHYRFFWSTARWLARRHPGLLALDWSDGEFEDRLSAAFSLLLPQVEAEAVKRRALPVRRAILRLKARHETDAAYFIRRIEAIPGGDRVREGTHDAIDVAYELAPSPGGPSRTHAELPGAPSALRTTAPPRGHPDLTRALRTPPRSVRAVSLGEGRRIVDLAREAMVTRARDLDAFAHGDARDVRLIDDGDGLAFALIGVTPERRLFLPAVYGALTLRNRIPIGYVQIDALFGNAEMSYNTFPTFRAGEAGFVFGRLLAATHHVFGVSSFSVEPYQLGHGNVEGLDSGAWWFYALCGFRPRETAVARLAASELARRRRDPRYRSSRATLERLATAHLHWPARAPRGTAVTPIDRIGLAIASRGQRADARESAMKKLGLASLRGWSRDERIWWERWAPMLDALPGIERWPASDRAAALRVVRAKAARRETDFVKRFEEHPRLGRAIFDLAGRL